ncbi:hypothetical protein [Mycobacterium sp. SMC-8]|uniref:hypothetical protein n=1 Tax=Mycobacterium sp. SMC-8 TaxID=2857060 RepID=UPI0021B30397|nr:hypothetical protein [Mycobacterium sp. SMC-8]
MAGEVPAAGQAVDEALHREPDQIDMSESGTQAMDETVTKLVGSAALTFARHLVQWQQLPRYEVVGERSGADPAVKLSVGR